LNHSISILSPTAILGYGFPESSFEAGLARNPDAIAVDAGSTDPGPYYLGSGVSFTNREAVKRDLTLMIKAGLERDIPVLIGTAGGSGARPHLQWCLEVIDEVLCDLNRSARVAERQCTVTSVAAHTLYEKTDPRFLPGPGGVLDLTACHFEQLDERRVRVTGTQLQKSDRYTIKLEGAQPVGFRTISIAGIRAPDLIQQLDEVLLAVRGRVFTNFQSIDQAEVQLLFRVYGKDGVMGELEPCREQLPHEVGLVIEVVAKTQSLADTVCSFARSTLLHFGYPGRQSTAGNLAFPYSPSDISHGVVYEFSVYHLMTVDDPKSPFPIQIKVRGVSR
jgi:hypothetical protein